MRRRRLFDELIDMQAEANAFFEDVSHRLSKLDEALSGWQQSREESYNRSTPLGGQPERLERRLTAGNGQTVIVERYERHIRTTPDVPHWMGTHRYPEPSSALNQPAPHRLPDSSQAALSSSQAIPIPRSHQDGGKVLARFEIDDLRPGDVEITLNSDSIVVSGKVYRKIMLPPGIDRSDIHAVYQGGVLEIRSSASEGSQSVAITFA